MDSVAVAAAIVAVTEGIKRLVPQVSGVVTIILAGVLGLIAGVLGLGGLDVVTGLIVGLSASGVVKVADSVAGK